MPNELTPIAGVALTGVPVFADPFTADLLPFYGGAGQSLNELAQTNEAAYPGAPEEALAPPMPTVLPPLPPQILPEVVVTTTRLMPSVLTGMGAGLLALLFPTATAPPQLDEAPTPPQKPPPPPIDPILAEPQLPPNWLDLATGGDSSLLEPIRTPGLPVPLPDWRDDPFWKPVELEPVTISPPQRTTRSQPSFPGLFADPFSTVPSGTPYDFPIPFDIGPGPAPAPVGTPGSNPAPGDPLLDPFAVPDVRIAPDPLSAPAPDLFGSPLPDPLGYPIGDPIPAPRVPAAPGPDARAPGAPGGPSLFADPLTPPSPDAFSDPLLTEFQPEPLRANPDQCQCHKPNKKKKPSIREKCFKGTYVQRTQGITFIPKEEVPCEKKPKKSVSNRETDPFGRPVPKRRKSRRTPTWQDTINDVFYPKP